MNEFIIYEEEFDSYDNEIALERALMNSNLSMDLVFYEYLANDEELTKTEKFKATIKRMIEAFKVFIIKCRDYLKSAITKLIGRIREAYTEYSLSKVFQNFDESIVVAQQNGMRSFKFVDMEALYECLYEESNKYTEIIKNFTKSYIKHGAPKDAEKVIKQYEEASAKYDKKLKEILNTKKEYSIREAKTVAKIIKLNNAISTGNYLDIIDKYTNTCKEIENLTVAAMNSLNKYSEDTGYIQNAKSLQDMIHNSCIRLQTHSAECVTNIIQYGIPLVCQIDKLAHTKKGLMGGPLDTSSEERKTIRKIAENISGVGGMVADGSLKAIRKTSRKEDIKDWKFTDGESPFTFDRRPIDKKLIKKTISKK